tara:strand:+ start:883 stop:1347 length:465 start_codon:yes stop_codon:yes gene_type:complete
MLNQFIFKINVQEEWIDYNNHMQDAYYGLAFSYAVDHFQDVVGFDEDYRSRTGCTIFVVEDHKFYLNEVKLRSELVIKTTLLDADKKKFILQSQMLVNDKKVATSEMLQAHVKTDPTPKITEMPQVIYDRFTDLLKQKNDVSMGLVSRKLSLHR